MNVPSIYKQLSKNTIVNDVLGWPFDFEICKPYILSDDWPILLSDELIVLAEDGSGGAYTVQRDVSPDTSPIIYLSSEGQAGKVAQNFTEFLLIIVALPYWQDLLKFSAGGDLEEMRKALPFLEKEILEDEPEISSMQAMMYKVLDLPPLFDPVLTLFSAVKSGISVEIKASDGYAYESLFNTFRVKDNRSWKH